MTKNTTVKEKNMLFHTCTKIKNSIYTCTSFGNLPVKIDLDSGEAELIKDLKGYEPFVTQDMLNDGESIFALELNGNRMMQCCLKDKVCHYFAIDCHVFDCGNYAAFVNHGGNIYIFPRHAEALVKIDLQIGKVQRYSELYKQNYFPDSQENNEAYLYFSWGCKRKQKVWLYQERKNMLVAYDLEKSTWENFELSIKIADCAYMVWKDDVLFMLSSEGRVFIWDLETHAMRQLVDCSLDKEEKNTFAKIVVTDQILYMLPALGEEIVCVSLKTGQAEPWVNYPEQFRYCASKTWCKYVGYCEDENYFYFAMRSANFMLCINKSSGEGRWLKPSPLPLDDAVSLSMKYHKDIPLSEDDWTLRDLADYMTQTNLGNSFGDGLACEGKRIWEKLEQ